jgi:hypothetical protein
LNRYLAASPETASTAKIRNVLKDWRKRGFIDDESQQPVVDPSPAAAEDSDPQ